MIVYTEGARAVIYGIFMLISRVCSLGNSEHKRFDQHIRSDLKKLISYDMTY